MKKKCYTKSRTRIALGLVSDLNKFTMFHALLKWNTLYLFKLANLEWIAFNPNKHNHFLYYLASSNEYGWQLASNLFILHFFMGFISNMFLGHCFPNLMAHRTSRFCQIPYKQLLRSYFYYTFPLACVYNAHLIIGHMSND